MRIHWEILPLILACIIMPHLESLAGLGPYNSKRFLEVIVLIYLSLLTFTRNSQHNHTSRILTLAFSVIFISGLVSSLNSQNPLWGIVEVSLFMLMLIGIYSLSKIYQEDPFFYNRVMITGITITALAYIPVFLAGYLAVVIENIPLTDGDLFGTFSNIRFFNQFLTWTLPLLPLIITLNTPKNRKKFAILTYTVMGFWWCMAIVSGSRGSIVGITIGCLTTLILFRKNAVNWAVHLSIGLILGSVLYIIITYVIPLLKDDLELGLITYRSLTDNANVRLDLWANALLQLKSSPLLGIGPMHLACDPDNILPASHPHNFFIQILAEWGIPMTVLFAIICIIMFYRWVICFPKLILMHRLDPMIPIALTASLASAGTHALFSGIIVMPTSQLLLVTNLGWMVGIYIKYGYTKVTIPLPATRNLKLYHVATGIITLFMVFFTLFEVYSFNANSEYTASETSTNLLLKPRFWQKGNICLTGIKRISFSK